MATIEPAPSGDLVFKPCTRSFFVYYVAMLLVFVGPRLNPEVGLPVWLGTILGVIVVAAVIYQKKRHGIPRHLPGSGPGLALAIPPPSGDCLGEPGRSHGAPGPDPDRVAGGQSRFAG